MNPDQTRTRLFTDIFSDSKTWAVYYFWNYLVNEFYKKSAER